MSCVPRTIDLFDKGRKVGSNHGAAMRRNLAILSANLSGRGDHAE